MRTEIGIAEMNNSEFHVAIEDLQDQRLKPLFRKIKQEFKEIAQAERNVLFVQSEHHEKLLELEKRIEALENKKAQGDEP